jgi:hypothetical protein
VLDFSEFKNGEYVYGSLEDYCVHNYNYWMGGVDKAYQLISYYKPTLRCRRTWLPLLISKQKDVVRSHKRFVMDWVKALNMRADAHDRQATRRALAELLSTPRNRD